MNGRRLLLPMVAAAMVPALILATAGLLSTRTFTVTDQPVPSDRRRQARDIPGAADGASSVANRSSHWEASAAPRQVLPKIEERSQSQRATVLESQPDDVIALLGMDREGFSSGRERYRADHDDGEWTHQLRERLPALDSLKEQALIENHAASLHLRDVLARTHMSGGIDHDTFQRALGELLRWNQRTIRTILTDSEYQRLLQRSPEEIDQEIDSQIAGIPRYRFVLNRDEPSEDLVGRIRRARLEDLDVEFRRVVLAAEEHENRVRAGQMSSEEAARAGKRDHEAFAVKAKQLLSSEEVEAVFGSVESLERGLDYRIVANLGEAAANGLPFAAVHAGRTAPAGGATRNARGEIGDRSGRNG